jgi:hypothetical protein
MNGDLFIRLCGDVILEVLIILGGPLLSFIGLQLLGWAV